jgi:5-formyltetrahydrofolate cyclo-ligase
VASVFIQFLRLMRFKNSDNKDTIRKAALATRRDMDAGEKKLADACIFRFVFTRPEIIQAKTVCIYESFRSEVDTKLIIAKLHEMKKWVLVPVKDSFDPNRVDMFIVPVVAIDKNGNRLGWGKGYYDKLLEGVSVPRIALAYENQVVAQVPCASYDVPMTMVITERRIL